MVLRGQKFVLKTRITTAGVSFNGHWKLQLNYDAQYIILANKNVLWAYKRIGRTIPSHDVHSAKKV